MHILQNKVKSTNWENKMDKLKDEKLIEIYNFFKQGLPSLLKDKDKKGKFALIKDQKIIGFYLSIDDAMEKANIENIEPGTFLVQKVEKDIVHHFSRIV